jgi:hypothetical protein
MKAGFRNFSALTLSLLLVFTASLGFAQGIVTGSISGTVVDPQGAVVTNASVRAVQKGTNTTYTATTNQEGFFSLRSLPIGDYSVTVDAAGFNKLSVDQISVISSKDSSIGTQALRIGSTETVAVEAQAPLVDAGSAQVTTTFETKQISDLPIGNGFDSLALYVPGVVSAGAAGAGNSNGPQLSINGQRTRSNNFQIDGQANNDNSVAGPSIFLGNADAIAEFQVITNYSAEYGRNTGGVVNYITKSGNNAFHGTGFEYYIPSLFDSLGNTGKSPLFGFCTPGQAAGTATIFAPKNPDGTGGCTKPKVSRLVDNQFGGTIGGPVLKDKMWFFGSYYGERLRTSGSPSQSGTNVTPTPNGINQLKALFPNNPAVAALATIGPTAVKAGNPIFTPTGNVTVIGPGGVSGPVEFGTITRTVNSPYNDHEVTGRYDWQISSKDHFFTRYIFQQNNNAGIAGNSIAAGDWVDLPARDQQIGLDYTRTFSDRFVNQARFSFSRARFGFEGGSYANCLQTAILNCPTFVAFGSATDQSFGRATNLPQGRIVNVTQYQDNATWLVGKHTLKFGGEYSRQRSPNFFLPNINGSYTFADFNSFLQNAPTRFSLVDGPPSFPFKEQDAAVYFQDDFRLKDNLTLYLGLRWEFFQEAINLLHDLTLKNQQGANPLWNASLPSSLTTVPHIPQDTNNFGPNIGFSWQPRILSSIFGQNKTVFRGSFRVAYDPAYYNIFLNVATSAPVINSGTFNAAPGVTVPGLPGSGAFTGQDVRNSTLSLIPRGGNPGLTDLTTVDPNFRNPYSEQWHFGMQRQLNNHLAGELRYEGSHSVASFQSANANPALAALINPVAKDPNKVSLIPAGTSFANVIPAGLKPCSDPNAIGFASGYVDCSRRNVFQRGNYGWGIYHAMVSQLRIQNFGGLTGDIGFTWSKNIDNVSEVFTRTGAGLLAFGQNPFDQNRAERAISSIDFPHVLSMALNYELPFYKSQQGLMARLLGGWQANTTYRFTSGEPYTLTQSKSVSSTSGSRLSNLCDPTNNFSASTDTCRPILENPNAPANSVGRILSITGGVPTVINLGNCVGSNGLPAASPSAPSASCPSVALNSVRYLVNNDLAAAFFGSPFLGVGRNTLRGDTINNMNFSMFKTTKLNERFSLRFQAQVFNLMNRQFRGVPSTNVYNAVPSVVGAPARFNTTFFNSTGSGTTNATLDGVGIRRMQFGLKVLF